MRVQGLKTEFYDKLPTGQKVQAVAIILLLIAVLVAVAIIAL